MISIFIQVLCLLFFLTDESIFLFTANDNIIQLPGYIYYKSSADNSYISKVNGIVQISSENVEIVHSSYFDNTIIPSNYLPSFDRFVYGDKGYTDYNAPEPWAGTALFETGYRTNPLIGFVDVYLEVVTTEKLIGEVGVAMIPNSGLEPNTFLHGRIVKRNNGLCVYISSNEAIVENMLKADANGDGVKSVQDIFDFLEAYFGI
jgi:hypothetical protein